MNRGRDRFCSEAEEREQNRYRASQMYSSQHNTPAPPDGQMRASYPATNPVFSHSVSDQLKELRTMSSSSTGGRNVQNVSRFGNGAPRQRNLQGLDNSGTIQNLGIGQHLGPQVPPGAPSSSVPFPPPVPPPPFNPSLPPPGLPPPFRGPHPSVGPAGSDAMFAHPPPPFPSQGVRPGYPQGNMSGIPGQVNLGMPPPSLETSIAAAPVSARPSAPQNNFRMASPSDNVGAARPGFGPGSAVTQNPFLPPPPPHPLPSRQTSSNLTGMEKSQSGSAFHIEQSRIPMSDRPTGEVDSDSGITETQKEVNRWLQKKGKRKQEASVTGDGSKKEKTGASERKDSREKEVTLSIGEAQDHLRSVLHALAAVQGELQQLEEGQGTADEATWETSVRKIRKLKEAYLETKQNLDTEQIKNLKPKLDLRRKKRRDRSVAERRRRRRSSRCSSSSLRSMRLLTSGVRSFDRMI